MGNCGSLFFTSLNEFIHIKSFVCFMECSSSNSNAILSASCLCFQFYVFSFIFLFPSLSRLTFCNAHSLTFLTHCLIYIKMMLFTQVKVTLSLIHLLVYNVIAFVCYCLFHLFYCQAQKNIN